jgi:hypothetical protein
MSQQQWYMAIGGHQVGPVSQDDVVTNLRNGTIDGNTLVFTAGMKNWTPLKDVPELAAFLSGGGATRLGAVPPPIVVRRALSIAGRYDLEPLGHAPFLRDDLRLTPDVVRRASPAYLPPPTGVLHAVAGANEPGK